jgi:hypothetical protein
VTRDTPLVVVRPAINEGWDVVTPEGVTTFALKRDALESGRRISRELPGRSLFVVMRANGTVEGEYSHGSDRPPGFSFAARTAVGAVAPELYA